MTDVDRIRERFFRIIEASDAVCGFTGAGISTESGIPDYRSKGGIWERYKPVYFQEFISDPAKRRLYWERKIEMWPAIRDAKPGAGHLFFKRLYDRNKLAGLITQNIDGLHEKSGIPSGDIINIHGSALEIRCLSCGRISPAEELAENLDLEQGLPLCSDCGGIVKPNTISFGQSLDPETLKRAEQLAASCDCMLVIGSTLVVYPAAGLPRIALENGAKLIILTLSETPFDAAADLVIHEKIADFLKGPV